MDLEEIYENLCMRDKRNPLYSSIFDPEDDGDIEPRGKDCYCNNCFKGKDRLAMEILRLREILEIPPESINDEVRKIQDIENEIGNVEE